MPTRPECPEIPSIPAAPPMGEGLRFGSLSWLLAGGPWMISTGCWPAEAEGQNAGIPVTACPRTSEWMSCVPS